MRAVHAAVAERPLEPVHLDAAVVGTTKCRSKNFVDQKQRVLASLSQASRHVVHSHDDLPPPPIERVVEKKKIVLRCDAYKKIAESNRFENNLLVSKVEDYNNIVQNEE
jgi:hypothetical protein